MMFAVNKIVHRYIIRHWKILSGLITFVFLISFSLAYAHTDLQDDVHYHRVSIDPSEQEVVQGYPADFEAKLKNKKYNVKFNWQLRKQKGEKKKFRVETKNLKPGTYSVKLVVTPKKKKWYVYRNNIFAGRDNPEAKLVVKPRPLKVTISSSTLQPVTKGSSATFTAKLYNNINKKEVRFKWELIKQQENGKKSSVITPKPTWKKSGGNESFTVDTKEFNPGNYRVQLVATMIDNPATKDEAYTKLKIVKPVIKPKKVLVPDLTQKYYPEALEFLSDNYNNFKVAKPPKYDEEYKGPNDWVFAQSPKPGPMDVSGKRIITLYVSRQKLIVKIYQDQKDEEIKFTVSSYLDTFTLFQHRWKVDGKEEEGNNDNSFTINTKNRSPNTYTVSVDVIDKYNREETAETTFEVIKSEDTTLIPVPNVLDHNYADAIKKLESELLKVGDVENWGANDESRVIEQTPIKDTPVIKGSVVHLVFSKSKPKPDFKLKLESIKPSYLISNTRRFMIEPSDPDVDAEYWLQLDDEQTSKKFKQLQFDYTFKKSDKYKVTVEARVDGAIYLSNPVMVSIWKVPLWLISIVAGTGLLILSVGVAKAISSSRNHPLKELKPARISIKAITDLGYQEISRVSFADSNSEGREYGFSVGFDYGLEDGDWELIILKSNERFQGQYSDKQENKI